MEKIATDLFIGVFIVIFSAAFGLCGAGIMLLQLSGDSPLLPGDKLGA
jgi:hypothetical protein